MVSTLKRLSGCAFVRACSLLPTWFQFTLRVFQIALCLQPWKGGGIEPRVSPRTHGQSQEERLTRGAGGGLGLPKLIESGDQSVRRRAVVTYRPPSPSSRVHSASSHSTTGSRTHPWLSSAIPTGIQTALVIQAYSRSTLRPLPARDLCYRSHLSDPSSRGHRSVSRVSNLARIRSSFP
jgi:hypothetical protein